MASILSNDTDLHLPRVTVVDASAGSGKTTALTHRLAQFLLSERIPHNKLPNLLAITFTNNAAVEMKQRVLTLLKRLALGDDEALKEMRSLVTLREPDLRKRAQQVLEDILDRYSDFQVQTIDSFLSRVFRASALEFGFSPGFEVVIDGRPLLDEAFDVMGGELVGGSVMADLLSELADRLLVTRSSEGKYLWNPYRDLSTQVKNLYARIVSTARPLLEEDYSKDFRTKGKRLCEVVEELGRTIDQSKLPAAVRFENYRAEAKNGRIDRLIELQFPEYPVTKTKSPQIEFAKFEKATRRIREQISSLRSDLVVLHARTYFQPYLETHRLLRKTLDDVRRRRGEVDLGEVTSRLSQFLRAGNVPDLYLTLGERIVHYLIDEFQDTSPIQWQTLMPLIDNSLSVGGSLFVVGDMKQSIYGFRGADWRIMKRLMEENVFPSASIEKKTLDVNYRSEGRILDFTKSVFQEIVPQLVTTGAAEESGLATFEQKPKPHSAGSGYVEVDFIEGDTEIRPEREQLLRVVADCLDRGYAQRDLAILTPENEDVVKVSGWLNEQGYEFIPFSTLDIRTRKVIGELLSLLRFLDSPIDDLALATVLTGDLFRERLRRDGGEVVARDVHRIIFEHRNNLKRRPLYSLVREQYQNLWNAYFDELFGLAGYLPLYDLTMHVYKRFGVFDLAPREEAALVKLLEVVKNFEEQGRNSLKEFVGFAEEISEDSDWNIDVPPDVNAIRIMTVHKAKGLGFKVAIVLLYDVPVRPDRVYMEETDDAVRLVRLVKGHEKEDSPLAQLLLDRDLKTKVDQLNKLYVAFTRAEEEMVVLSVRYPQAKEPSAFLPEKGFKQQPRPPASASTPPSQPRARLVHHNVRATLQLRGFERIHPEETRRGETIHRILARIEFAEKDIGSQIARGIETERYVNREEFDADELGQLIRNFLGAKETAEFFRKTNDRIVMNEQEFTRSDGQLFRLDRVVADPDTVTVLDYKTGEERKEYETQVKNYLSLVREVFPKRRVRGVIAYVDKNILRRVE